MNILTFLPDYLSGVGFTVVVTVLSFAGSLLIGVLVALLRLSPVFAIRSIGRVYVEVIRNTPALVQLYFAYFGLPGIGIHLSPFVATVITLAVNGGAYNAEIIRAGIISVPTGQREAATVLGLSRASAFIHVVLPQALRAVYLPLINILIGLLLDTALASVIGLTEITHVAELVNSQTFETIPAYGLALVFYLIISNLIAFAAAWTRGVLFKPSLRPHVSKVPHELTGAVG